MKSPIAGVVLSGVLLLVPVVAAAQTASQDGLRSTIYTQITSDPRSKGMTQAQIYSMVNALSAQAQKQGVTQEQLAPQSGAGQQTTLTSSCGDFACGLSRAFGLDGSIPLIPIALLILGALFIAIYSVMRELGHPHAQA